MRILLITSDFASIHKPILGKKRLEFAESLIERGHEVGVVTLGSVSRVVNEVYKRVRIVRIPQFYNPPSMFYPIPNFPLLVKSLYSFSREYDILHFFKQAYPISLSAHLNVDKPKVLTIDSFPGLDYEHGIFLINFASFVQSMTVGKLLLKRFNRLVSLSKVSVKTAMKLGVKKDRIDCIPHGIDTNKIRPDSEVEKVVKEKMRLKGPVFSFIGRLSPVKGIIYLASATRNLERSGIEGNLLIIGDGIERTKLLALKKNKNLKVHFLGFQKNVMRFIQASDFVVLPSLAEGCPNVVLEAFACGKPVIATKVGGVPDLVNHMKTGILVNPKDVAQLVKAMYVLITDPYQGRIMGKEARKFAEEQLDWNIIIGKYEKVYRQVLESQ